MNYERYERNFAVLRPKWFKLYWIAMVKIEICAGNIENARNFIKK